MKLKANLHFHTKEDPRDVIAYDLFAGIDKAQELGFNVLASTCHTKNVVTQEHIAYARSKDILLIPGIESDIYETGTHKRNHVLILNCDASADDVHTFEDLKKYRANHPDIFVIAPHPYFFGTFNLAERLEKYIHLFDAVELSWFYTSWLNRNVRAAETAEKFDKPFIATSDTHFFTFMNTNFVTVEAHEKTPGAFFDALQKKAYENTTSPRSFFDIFGIFLSHELCMEFKKLKRVIEKMIAPKPNVVPSPVLAENKDNHA